MRKKYLKYVKLGVAAISVLLLGGCGQSIPSWRGDHISVQESQPDSLEDGGASQMGDSQDAFITEADRETTEVTSRETIVETSEEIKGPEIVTVELLAVGDNLIHTGLYQTGMNASGIWNYDHLYAAVKDEIEAADLAIINQETIFIKDRNKISAYPSFGSPTEIGDSVVNAGFDVVLHASNHTMDKGAEGVHDTLSFWKEQHPEITVLGINESAEDQEIIDVVECQGIRFAMLNYTYWLNGYSMPANEPYLVNMLDKERVAADIAKAKEVGDMVIVFCHVGDEYVYEPSEYSKQWVDFLLEQGVDIAINAHPHVVEPYTVLTREDGHEMLVYYSVGNFISTQDKIPRLLGGMAKITIQMVIYEEERYFSIVDYTMEPLVAHWNYSTMEFGVYMLEDYTNELAAKHGIRKKTSEAFSVEVLWELFEEVMGMTVKPAQGKLN